MLLDFEAQFVYPSDTGSFSISHAPNYKYFFESLRFNMEDPQLFLAKSEKGEILGLIIIVLQMVPHGNGFIDTWYLCDFKISHKAFGASVLFSLLRAVKETCFPLCSRVYALSMNSKGGSNRIVMFCENNPFLRFKKAGDINLYEIQHWDAFKCPNLSCIQSSKIILVNRMPLNLWHVVNSTSKDSTLDLGASPILLYGDIHGHNLPVWGTCAILQYGLENMHWDWIRSADI